MRVLFFTKMLKFRYNFERVVQCYWLDGSMPVKFDTDDILFIT